jgi:hypothetical protein
MRALKATIFSYFRSMLFAIIIKALKVYIFSTTVHESFEGQNLFLFPIDAVLEKFASTEDGLLRNSEALLFYLRYSQLVILLFF